MKKILLLISLLLMLVACTQKDESNKEEERKETPHVRALKQLTLAQYDEFLREEKSSIVYFGWIDRCGDSLNFQENYLEQLLIDHPELKDQIVIVNLEIDAYDALIEHELRAPLIEKYDVGYSPTLLLVEAGKTVNKIEWTLKDSDPQTAIPRSTLDAFFTASGYLN